MSPLTKYYSTVRRKLMLKKKCNIKRPGRVSTVSGVEVRHNLQEGIFDDGLGSGILHHDSLEKLVVLFVPDDPILDYVVENGLG